MRDTRSLAIKKLLKKHYPTAKFSVRINKYSMGESIDIYTDLINPYFVPTPWGGVERKYSDQANKDREAIETLLRSYESIDRDQWGEILSGGNTYLFVNAMQLYDTTNA